MSGTKIVPQTTAARNGRTLAEVVSAFLQQPDPPGAIRHRIRFLRKTYGRRLALWPTAAQAEYRELARRLRQLESERNR